MGLVLPNLEAYQRLVHEISDAHFTSNIELTFKAPLYKCTPEIKDRLKDAGGVLDKFDIYFEGAVLNEEVRVQIAQTFRKQYVARAPRSEASDIFYASGDILQFSFEMKHPSDLDGEPELLEEVARYPHDTEVVHGYRDFKRLNKEHRTGEVRLYLDHVFNPRWRDLEAVRAMMAYPWMKEPVVAELFTSGAIPGAFVWALWPMLRRLEGGLIWLPD